MPSFHNSSTWNSNVEKKGKARRMKNLNIHLNGSCFVDNSRRGFCFTVRH